MMKAKSYWIAFALVVVGLLLVVLASSAGQRAFQHMKYGDPMTFCVGDVGVTLKRDWQIALLKRSDSEWPLVAGLFPAPISFGREDGSVAQVSVRSAKHDREVSIHRTREINAADEVRNSCKASLFCKLTVSRFDARSEVVEISSSGTTWVKYLDRPVMIGLHGAVGDDLSNIALGDCSKK